MKAALVAESCGKLLIIKREDSVLRVERETGTRIKLTPDTGSTSSIPPFHPQTQPPLTPLIAPGLSKGSSPGSPKGSLWCSGKLHSPRGPRTFMRLPAAESTHTSTHHTTTTTMSCEQEFGDGAMGVTLTLRLLMHGKEVGSIIGKCHIHSIRLSYLLAAAVKLLLVVLLVLLLGGIPVAAD
eukprot:superscaffoldBa00006134_g21184